MRQGCGWYDGDMLRYIRDMVHMVLRFGKYVSECGSDVSEICLEYDWDGCDVAGIMIIYC